jgi:DNA polymerase III delta prime subunit
MNNRIYNLVKNEINDYTSTVEAEFSSNAALFEIFDNFLHTIKSNKKVSKDIGVELITVLQNNLMKDNFNIGENSWNKEGVAFIIKFDGVMYTLRFKKFRDGDKMHYFVNINNTEEVKYSCDFLYKYLMFSALESSKLKGSYFSMPRGRFDWDIKEREDRTFNDIFLPSEILEDLHLYVDIYKESDKILRYLKVGNPGVGKTEATLVLASELNKLGVTIIKTPICETLHQKVELANVLAPALIIFDDIDLSLGDRNKGAYSTLLGDFLDVLDGTDKLADNVGVIATTNAAHLLDLAAQRPGRFDKTLLFDDITRENIRDIILKSLKSNFNITKGKLIKVYTANKIVNKFYDAGVSGSHIYNAIKMLKLRYDTLKITDVTSDRIIKSIESELKVIDKIRKVSVVKEKLDRGSGSVGFKAGFTRSGNGNNDWPEDQEVTETKRDYE